MQSETQLKHIKYWVFDMDGTLTQAVHDFVAIRQALDIPLDEDILAHLQQLPEAERQRKNTWLIDHELALAEAAKPALGAVGLVKYLHEQGYHLALLTRNDYQLAHITLEAIGLADYFESRFILGRDEAAPKPAPDGLFKLAEQWQVSADDLLIVGDAVHDLACGRNAKSHTVLVNKPTNAWPELVDWYFSDCQALLAHLQS